ncbi:MAG TPA: hypothetical protein VLJ79_09270 [Candidatus Binatia bacterium]|nr:hypothetical protein [Candidatus Binatia bacterium]
MKSFSESRGSLDIPPISARLKLKFILMSRVKKTALALSVLFSLEFLFLGLFADGTFSWTNQYVSPRLHTDAGGVKLDSPTKTDGGFVLERDGELTPRSGGFLAAKENVGISFRSFVVSPLFFRITLVPKVSRYISKSVLNL